MSLVGSHVGLLVKSDEDGDGISSRPLDLDRSTIARNVSKT
jgi:hypothetical protein